MRITKTFLVLFFIAFSFFLVTSCDKLISDGRVNEGEIEFDVSYPKMSSDNFMIDVLPDKMVLTFQEDRYITEITAGMGMFRTNFMSDADNMELTQLVKLLNKKHKLTLNQDGVKEMLEKNPKYKVEFTNETKEIAGYHCKKANITTSGDETFSVFYTEDINIKTPNWATPYHEINGVLLEYQMEKYDLCMRFTATNVTTIEVEDELFESFNDYEEISEQEMDEKLSEIFESFNQ